MKLTSEEWELIHPGKENLWEEPFWGKVLQLIAKHDGEGVYDENASIYKSLAETMPEFKWTTVEKDTWRPEFRDHRKSWEFSRTADFSEQKFHLTSIGRLYVEGKCNLQEVLRNAMPLYSESKGTVSYNPFAKLARAFLSTNVPLNLKDIHCGVMQNPDFDSGFPENLSLVQQTERWKNYSWSEGNGDTDAKTTTPRKIYFALQLMFKGGLIKLLDYGTKLEHLWVPWDRNGLEMLSKNLSPFTTDAASYTGSAGVNKIFFGPPGTGKSTKVKELIGSSPMFRTQFHPEYTHVEFVGGYRPVVGFENTEECSVLGHDGVAVKKPVNYFAFVPGPFTLALEKALTSREHVFLVVEEINRGDCASIFGDVFQLLDRNDDGKSEFTINPKPELLKYFADKGVVLDDSKLCLPANLSLLATMNTSDQSLYPMDSAFKRRWQWVACEIEFDSILQYLNGQRPFLDDGKTRWDWIEFLLRLNKSIVRDRSEDNQIGAWFIRPNKDGEVPFEAFVNKCLFYLWHDVFKDEQFSEPSPFKSSGFRVFSELQNGVRLKGIEFGIKNELLVPLKPTAASSQSKATADTLSEKQGDSGN